MTSSKVQAANDPWFRGVQESVYARSVARKTVTDNAFDNGTHGQIKRFLEPSHHYKLGSLIAHYCLNLGKLLEPVQAPVATIT